MSRLVASIREPALDALPERFSNATLYDQVSLLAGHSFANLLRQVWATIMAASYDKRVRNLALGRHTVSHRTPLHGRAAADSCERENATNVISTNDRSRGSHRLLSFAPAVAWMAVIFALSSRPSLPTGGIGAVSILGHFGVYAVLAALLFWGLRREGLPLRRAALFSFAIAVLYGVSDEVHQDFVPGRDPDPLDLLVDAVGAATALGAIALWLTSRQSGLQSRVETRGATK